MSQEESKDDQAQRLMATDKALTGSTRGYDIVTFASDAGEGSVASSSLRQSTQGKLGGYASSSFRSNVTKSFGRNSVSGWDSQHHDDPSKTMEQIVKVASSRQSRTASLLSEMSEPSPPEDELKWFLFIPLTNNVKSLAVMCFMFALISTAQVFAARAAHSQALMIDVISMYVDAVSYLGNIFGECSDVASQRIVLQLFFSAVSITLLLYFNTTNFLEVIETVEGGNECDPVEEGPGVDGTITTVFGGLGLLFDVICLFAYRYYAKKDAEAEFELMNEEHQESGKKAKIKKSEINMLTALLHVSADLFRSTSTFVLGIVLCAGGLCPVQQEFVDAAVGIAIGGTLYIAAAYAVFEWLTGMSSWFKSLGDPIRAQCPDCASMVEVKAKKIGHGKAADAFLG